MTVIIWIHINFTLCRYRNRSLSKFRTYVLWRRQTILNEYQILPSPWRTVDDPKSETQECATTDDKNTVRRPVEFLNNGVYTSLSCSHKYSCFALHNFLYTLLFFSSKQKGTCYQNSIECFPFYTWNEYDTTQTHIHTLCSNYYESRFEKTSKLTKCVNLFLKKI